MLELMSARRRAEERSAPAREISGDRCVVSTDGSMVCEDDSSMVLPPVESLKVGNTYQFAFQPAMSMVNRSAEHILNVPHRSCNSIS